MRVIPADSAARVSARVRWAMAGVAAFVLVTDQVSKSLILAAHATAAGSGWIMVRLVRNTGASGGIASGHPELVSLAGLVITAAAVMFALRVRGRVTAVFLTAACAGGIGNLADRLMRDPGLGRGPVVDWIHVAGRGGSFNVADLAIQLGALGAVIAVFATERAHRHASGRTGDTAGDGATDMRA